MLGCCAGGIPAKEVYAPRLDNTTAPIHAPEASAWCLSCYMVLKKVPGTLFRFYERFERKPSWILMRLCRKAFVLLAFVGISSGIGKSAVAEEPFAIDHGPYLLEPGEDSVTIVWTTNLKSFSWVEYGTGENPQTFPVWGSVVQKAYSSRHGLIDAYTTLHAVRITGLNPGQRYRYRVVAKEMLQFKPYEVVFGEQIVSEVYAFDTLDRDKASFSFAVVADVHGKADMLDTLLEDVPWEMMDMVFFAGDTLSWLETRDQIFEGFLDVSVNRFAKEIPLIFIRGNHETRGHFARNLMDYFPASGGKFYLSCDHGLVHFIVLDSGEDKPDSHPVYAGIVDFDQYREEQAKWLKKDVQSSAFQNALYKIVLFHIPPFLDSDWHGPQDVTRRWGPILNEAGIDLVISGHRHEYAFNKPAKDKNAFPIVVLDQEMLLTVDVSTKQLTLKITDLSGEIVAQFAIQPEDASSLMWRENDGLW